MNARPLSVVIVDDHPMVATALASALEREPHITITGAVTTLAELQQLSLPDSGPHVAVVDYQLHDDTGIGTGIDVARWITSRYSTTRVVIVTGNSNPAHLREALAAGCVGYLDKSHPVAELQRAIEAAARGEATFDATLLAAAVSRSDTAPTSSGTLSSREQQILTLLSAGHGTEVIATELYLSAHTVRNHVRNLCAKLGAHSRLEAVAIAARTGLTDPPGTTTTRPNTGSADEPDTEPAVTSADAHTEVRA